MENIILIFSITSFLTGGFFLFANLTGHLVFMIFARLTGLLGTLLPIHYWLHLLNN